MAKGKHAAAAARRRLHDAEERIAELERLRAEESAAAHAREEELKAQVASLEGRLVSDVQALAEERLRRADRQHHADLKAAKDDFNSRIRRGLELIGNSKVFLEFDTWVELAEILDMEVGNLIQLMGAEMSRDGRRATNKRAKHLDTLYKQGRL